MRVSTSPQLRSHHDLRHATRRPVPLRAAGLCARGRGTGRVDARDVQRAASCWNRFGAIGTCRRASRSSRGQDRDGGAAGDGAAGLLLGGVVLSIGPSCLSRRVCSVSCRGGAARPLVRHRTRTAHPVRLRPHPRRARPEPIGSTKKQGRLDLRQGHHRQHCRGPLDLRSTTALNGSSRLLKGRARHFGRHGWHAVRRSRR